MKPTLIISLPRSGHHLLVRGLMEACHPDFFYSEGYKTPVTVQTCECINFQKSHDFDLNVPQSSQYQYVVLYRSIPDALRSWYAQSVRYEGYEGTPNDFALLKHDYIKQWHLKWLRTEFIRLEYSALVADKGGTIRRLSDQLGYNHQPNSDAIDHWVFRERYKYRPL